MKHRRDARRHRLLIACAGIDNRRVKNLIPQIVDQQPELPQGRLVGKVDEIYFVLAENLDHRRIRRIGVNHVHRVLAVKF